MKQNNGFSAPNPTFSTISNAFAVLDIYPLEFYKGELARIERFISPLSDPKVPQTVDEHEEIAAHIGKILNLIEEMHALESTDDQFGLHYNGKNISIYLPAFLRYANENIEEKLSAILLIKEKTLDVLSADNWHDFLLINKALDKIYRFLEYLHKG